MKLQRFRFTPLSLFIAAVTLSLSGLFVSKVQDIVSPGASTWTAVDGALRIASEDISLFDDDAPPEFAPSLVDSDPIGAPLPNVVRLRALRSRIQTLEPVDGPETVKWNLESLETIIGCMEKSTCLPNQEKVVLLASYHFWAARSGFTSGESIWAGSTLRALEALNYTLLWSWDAPYTLLHYQYIPDMISIILWEPAEMDRCMKSNITNLDGALKDGILFPDSTSALDERVTKGEAQDLDDGSSRRKPSWGAGTTAGSDNDGTIETIVKSSQSTGCVKTHDYPFGIPVWKSFAFHFWGDSKSPLGAMWTLSPYDRGSWKSSDSNQYLGYSIEHTCSAVAKTTIKKPQGLLLGKFTHFFKEPEMAFPNMLQGVGDKIRAGFPQPTARDNRTAYGNFSFIGTAIMGQEEKLPEEGVTFLPVHAQKEWTQLLSESSVLVGLGWPQLSPSPYDALCLGVPFINVVEIWDEQDPLNRSKWSTQHDALLSFNPPYVYHVHAKDAEGLATAVKDALDHPIDPFIAPGMSSDEVLERHRLLVETDWLLWAEEFVDAEWGDTQIEFVL